MCEIGTISLWAGDLANLPTTLLYCDGSPYRSGDHWDLFKSIGTTWGVGDGVNGNDFNVPDLRGRSPIGVDGEAGVGLAQAAGALTSAHDHGPGTYQAQHSHTLDGTALAGIGADAGQVSSESPAVTGQSGSASPSVLHPVMGLYYVIYRGY